jgi:hypothetical protein
LLAGPPQVSGPPPRRRYFAAAKELRAASEPSLDAFDR